ncbi:hypothetical protein MNBD_GAMMA08-2049 [hydrothermal vent metagenome]|uniref:Uncharacterized protein n=1 Tax=hydrothermal vent metagenome TaxID=652676 RepID=A0A3B0XGA9_9ZZZZ
MYALENKSNEYSCKTDANSIIQKKVSGKTVFRFNDNRPRSILQKKRSGIKDDKAQLEQPSALPHIPDNRPLTPVQRAVQKSTAPWGPTKGQWVTTLNTSVGYATREEAQAAEQRIIDERIIAEENAWQAKAQEVAWVFKDAAGRLTAHFNDGWGASYGITSYDDLRIYIENNVNLDEESEGNNTIDLGQKQNSNEHISKNCDIKYNATPFTVTVGSITRQVVKREVYHCGPAN